MTERPFIPSTAHRLLAPHRPSPLVCSGPESRKDGEKRLFAGAKPDPNLAQNPESGTFTHNTIESGEIIEPADNALSP